MYRKTRRRPDESQHRPLRRRVLVAPFRRHTTNVVHVVVERRVILGTGEVHAVRVPKRFERVARFRVAPARIATAHVTERRPRLRRPQAASVLSHEVVHRPHLVVLRERVHPEIPVKRYLNGFRLPVPVLDPVRQQQRAVQRFGETQGAQEMIHLVAEPAHARAVGDVTERVVIGERRP